MEDIITVIKGTELKLRMEVDLGLFVLMDCNFQVTAYCNTKKQNSNLKSAMHSY